MTHARPVLELELDEIVRLRRRHPCGSDEWRVERLGADIGLRYLGCERRILLARADLERRVGSRASRATPGASEPRRTAGQVVDGARPA